MKKFVILFFSCAILQFTYGSDLQNLQSDPNSIQGSMESDVLVNAKSPMARRDPRLFFGVKFFCICSTESLEHTEVVMTFFLIRAHFGILNVMDRH